eukprot:12819945-Alexandrium_andersonii.AAC.1
MSASLVGSEMCIRDRPARSLSGAHFCSRRLSLAGLHNSRAHARRMRARCLLYTSDAADDM